MALPGDVPNRFAVRTLRVGPGPVFTRRGFRLVRRRVFGMVLDRATGAAVWTFAESGRVAHETLSVWAEAQIARPVANPYEPAWKPPEELSPAKRTAQAELRRMRSKEIRERGVVEAEKKIERLRDRGALFVVSHSGGKDSQAMATLVSQLVPSEQIVWVHAPLHGVEWAGIVDQVERYKPPSVPLIFADALDKHGEQKWLLERVLERGKWPSKGQRWCTSDFKRGPIRREVRAYADANDFTIIVDAEGKRAEESSDRANEPALHPLEGEHGKRSLKLKKKREWYKWLPIKWHSTDEVFGVIEAAGEQPMWTYLEGMSRASCAFCVLGSLNDLRVAARLAPELYAMYVAVEKHVGHTIQTRRRGGQTVPYPLEEATGIPADPKLVEGYLRQIEETGELRDLPVAGRSEYERYRKEAAKGKRAPQLRVFGQMEVG